MGRTTADFRTAVAEAMADIAAGHVEAVWDLHDLATPAIRGLVRREAQRVGVQLDTDDLDGLILDAVLELARVARSWRTGEALPWVWARRRIEALVHRFVGTFAQELDDDLDVEAPPPPLAWVEPVESLRRLATRHPAAWALQARLDAAVSERDAAIWLAVQVERQSGNRSPAVTVGADHGVRPDAVRKVVERVGRRVAIASPAAALAA